MAGNTNPKNDAPSIDAIGLGFAAVVAVITVAAATVAHESEHIDKANGTVSFAAPSQLGLDTVSWLNGLKTYR